MSVAFSSPLWLSSVPPPFFFTYFRASLTFPFGQRTRSSQSTYLLWKAIHRSTLFQLIEVNVFCEKRSNILYRVEPPHHHHYHAMRQWQSRVALPLKLAVPVLLVPSAADCLTPATALLNLSLLDPGHWYHLCKTMLCSNNISVKRPSSRISGNNTLR